MLIAGFMPESFVDWRGKIVATVFTHGCNFRCPFCHNHALVLGAPVKRYREEDVIKTLRELSGWVDGVCITGGEPTLHRDIVDFVGQVSRFMPVKLDTNGTFPDILEKLLPMVDYVAMDIKAPPERYGELAGVQVNIQNVNRSVSLIMEKARDYEFRTTFVPSLRVDDIGQISEWIRSAKRYVIQQFSTAGGTLDIRYATLNPHPPEILEEACAVASRGVEECVIANL